MLHPSEKKGNPKLQFEKFYKVQLKQDTTVVIVEEWSHIEKVYFQVLPQLILFNSKVKSIYIKFDMEVIQKVFKVPKICLHKSPETVLSVENISKERKNDKSFILLQKYRFKVFFVHFNLLRNCWRFVCIYQINVSSFACLDLP